jgi:hypothetical protein
MGLSLISFRILPQVGGYETHYASEREISGRYKTSCNRLDGVFSAWKVSMSSVADQTHATTRPKRVSLRPDDDEFVVSSWPHDVIIFRNRDAEALRKACRFLHWQVVSDLFVFADNRHSVHG